MKKCTIVTLIMAFSIAILSSGCPAQTVTDTTKLGSLLIWPKIVTATTSGNVDTLVMFHNASSSAIDVKCYWEMKKSPASSAYTDCDTPDFQFRLTGNQPAVFSAKTGEHLFGEIITKSPPIAPFGDDEIGLLKCWAVNASAENQISWNYLKGEAIIVDYVNGSAWEYNAYRFAATPSQRAPVGTTPGRLVLNGTTDYDACPSYILFDFLAQSENVSSDLTLVPCAQNLKQEGGSTITKATFTIWNENEVKFTGAHQCLHCFLEWPLDSFRIPQDNGKIKPFTRARLHTNAARMRVQGLASKLCLGSGVPGQDDTPLLGVLDTKFVSFDGFSYKDIAGTHASTAGKFTKNPVWIQWDKGYPAEEKGKR